jgi:hypothetical protein
MRFANANELHRKSGGAQPRDLQCALPERNCEGVRALKAAQLLDGEAHRKSPGGPPWHGWRWMDKANVEPQSSGGERLIDLFSFLFPSHDLEGKLQLVFQLERAPSNRDQFDVVVSLVQGEITGRP